MLINNIQSNSHISAFRNGARYAQKDRPQTTTIAVTGSEYIDSFTFDPSGYLNVIRETSGLWSFGIRISLRT